MTELLWTQLYFLGVLISLLCGIQIYRKEILDPYTDTGSGVFIFSVVWLPAIVIFTIILTVGLIMELVIKALRINL